MTNIIGKLHAFETELSDFKDCKDPLDIGKLKELILKNNMEDWLEADMSTLKSILGDKLLNNEDTLAIKKESLLAIEDLVILEPPVTIKLADAVLKYMNSPAWSYNIESEYGNMSISFVVLHNSSLIRD